MRLHPRVSSSHQRRDLDSSVGSRESVVIPKRVEGDHPRVEEGHGCCYADSLEETHVGDSDVGDDVAACEEKGRVRSSATGNERNARAEVRRRDEPLRAFDFMRARVKRGSSLKDSGRMSCKERVGGKVSARGEANEERRGEIVERRTCPGGEPSAQFRRYDARSLTQRRVRPSRTTGRSF